MIINSGATVKAEGVTFYFPDVNSEIRANGGLTFTAPTSGTYKDILMFEKTSDASNNHNPQQYVFNGSKGEILKGIIHLPNRDVTYNSTTNQTNNITLVVNTIIMNSANWKVEPLSGGGSTPTSGLANPAFWAKQHRCKDWFSVAGLSGQSANLPNARQSPPRR